MTVRTLTAAAAAACRICGCTDWDACDGGCSWVADPEQRGPLCSACRMPGPQWRLIPPLGTVWRVDGPHAFRTDCYVCQGGGRRQAPCAACAFNEPHPAESCTQDQACHCQTPMRAVLPRPAALTALADLPSDYDTPAGLLYDDVEGGDLVAAIAIATDLRRGLAAISASTRSELGHRLARPGPHGIGSYRLVAARITGLLITISAGDVDRYEQFVAGDERSWVPWDAQPAPLDDPDAVAGTWAAVTPW